MTTTVSATRRRGLFDNVMQRRSEVVRVYYRRIQNCLLNVFDHCCGVGITSTWLTCGKQPELQWLTFERSAGSLPRREPRSGNLRRTTAEESGYRAGVCGRPFLPLRLCAASWLLQKYVPGIKVAVGERRRLTAADEPGRSPPRHGQYFFQRDVYTGCGCGLRVPWATGG